MTNIERINLSDIIAEEMKTRIQQKIWNAGDKLPSEKSLSEEFGVNRLTVRLAINKLNTIGILETRVGEGTFVKKLNLYNYINQIVPFIISSQDINYIIDFEDMIIRDTVAELKLSKEEVQKITDNRNKLERLLIQLQQIYRIKKTYDTEILDEITDIVSEIKEMIILKNSNNFLVSLYRSLKEPLRQQVQQDIKNYPTDNLEQYISVVDDLIKNVK